VDTSGIDAECGAVRTLDHELDLIRGAVAMVASGGAPRVRLANLRFGEQLLEQARRMATAAGVSVVPVWTSDEGGVSLIVEPIGDA
jgi:hypothetical protein